MTGYVFNFQGHGAFAPDGKVEMSPEQIEAHNKQLAQAEIEQMKEHGAAVLYRFAKDGKLSVGTWDSSFKFLVSYSKTGRHNMAGSRLDLWFTGPDGKNWHGLNIGDNDIVRCKRVKN